MLRPPSPVPPRRGCRRADAGIPMVAYLPSSPAAIPSPGPAEAGLPHPAGIGPAVAGHAPVNASNHELLITRPIRSTARETGEPLLQATPRARPAAGIV